VGGSGLIVVVIVAAWALFLVPQLLHRRARAAAHLADRLPLDGSGEALAGPAADLVADHGSDPVAPPGAPRLDPVDLSGQTAASVDAEVGAVRLGRRRFGRRVLVRPAPGPASAGGWRARLRLGRWGRPLPRPAARPQVLRSAAARRRRVLAVLALATLVTALVVSVGALLGLPVPGWLVAIPGLLMVGYLVLLALVHPRQPVHSSAGARVVHPSPAAALPAADLWPAPSPRLDAAAAAPADVPAAEPAEQDGPVAARATADRADPRFAGDGTWTPVPVPVPTYVTAPKARRTVRTIDLSNPGSWTSAAVGAPVEVAVAVGAGADAAPAAPQRDDSDSFEHRRAVGD